LDELARAYAALGVTPGASLEDVRKRYKALVRQWHPDRFTRDPQGQAEAALRMRTINDAFRAVVAARVVPGAAAAGAPPPPASFSGRRLTREEIERMVEAMRNDGPLDWLLGDREAAPKLERTTRAILVGTFFAVIGASLAEAGGASPPAQLAVMLGVGAAGTGVALGLLPRPRP
jgi:hypothetical protein